MTGNESLSASDELLMLAILRGESVVDAAEGANVSTATAHRRLREPAFAGELHRRRSELVESSFAKLLTASGKAADRLAVLVESSDSNVALKAAKSLLELAMKMRAECEFDRRLAALEERTVSKERQHA